MTKTSMTSGNFGLIARDYISKMGGSLGRIGKALLYPIAVLPIAAIMLRIGAAIPTDNASDFAKGVASFITNAGDFAFANLHILFAVGIAFGLTKDARGEAALAGFVGIALLTVLMSKGGVDLTGKIYGNIDLGRSSSVADTYKYIDNAVVAGQPLTATKVIDVPASSVRGFAALFTGGNYNKILATNVLSGFFAGGLVAYIYNRFQGVQLPSVLGFFSGRRLVPVLAVMGIMTFGILYAIVFP